MPSPGSTIIAKEAGIATRGAAGAMREVAGATRFGFSPVETLVGGLSKVTSLATSAVWIGPMLGGALGWLADRKLFGKVAGPMKKASAVTALLNSPISGDVALFEPDAALPIADAVKNILGHEHKVTAAVNAASTKFTHYAQKTFSPDTAKRLSENTIGNTIYSGAMIVGETTNAILTFKNRMDTLKQMQKALTGHEPSTFALLFGRNLHPLVKAASKEAVGMRAGIASLLQFAGVGANVYMMLGSKDTGMKYMVKSTVLSMGTSMAASAITSGSTALSSYRELSQYAANNVPAPEQVYTNLIGGLAGRADYRLVNDIAKQAAEKQLSPAEVLQLVSATDFLRKPPAPVAAPAALNNAAAQTPGKYAAAEDARRAQLSGKGAGRFAPA